MQYIIAKKIAVNRYFYIKEDSVNCLALWKNSPDNVWQSEKESVTLCCITMLLNIFHYESSLGKYRTT